MSDPILCARIHALEEQLTVVENSPKWLETMPFRTTEIGEELHDGLDGTFGTKARQEKRELQAILNELRAAERGSADDVAAAIRAGWERYLRVQQESQEIFSECLQFLGGVAIRNEGFEQILDNQIWEVADELIRSCARESTGYPWTSLTVPAPEEAVAKTLARMIRLRFPDWNVWTIPLAAREYGHVVAEDVAGLVAFIDREVEDLVRGRLEEIVAIELATHVLHNPLSEDDERALRATLMASAEDAAEHLERPPGRLVQVQTTDEELDARVRDYVADTASRERERLHILVADVFATYSMGIAYAAPAILLRFGPGRRTREDVVSDAERGEVVLAMLDRMDREATGSPYRALLDRLREDWSWVLDHVPTTHGFRADDGYSAVFVDKVWAIFDAHLRTTARYPHDADSEGWLSVRKVQLAWQASHKASGEFTTTDLELRKLRDALNAAWAWRLENPADEQTVKRLENAVTEICRALVADGRRAGGRRRRTGQRASGAARRT